MASNFERVYRTTDRDNLDQDYFNRRWLDVDARPNGLELNQETVDKAVDTLNKFGLERIDAALAPNLARIQDAASLGFLSAHVAADFEMRFILGDTAVPLLKDARQALFTPSPFVVLIRTTDVNSYAVAQNLGYNKTTGVLQIKIISQYGPTGPFSDVEVWAVAGSALAFQHQLTGTQQAQTGAETARNQAQAAATAAAGSATTAVSASNAATVSAQQAATAAAVAQNTSAGAIKVVGTDNTPGVLNTKLTVAAPLKTTVSAPTGDARMALSVNLATTTDPGVMRFAAAADITAGTSTDSAVTPAQLKTATAGISASGNTSLFYDTRNNSSAALAAAQKATWLDLTGTFVMPFTAAATLGNGWWCILKNAGTGEITLDPNSSETIDGLTSYKMYPGEVRQIQCDGTRFRSVVIQGFAVMYRGAGNKVFTRPPGYNFFDVALLGGGGGGEGGGSRSTGTGNIYGGSAGSGAALTHKRISASEMGATESITIGAGGAGGAGRAYQTSFTFGLPGQDGQPSTFGNHLLSLPGRGGYEYNHVGASTVRNAEPGSTRGGGLVIDSANADNDIIIPEYAGGGGGKGTPAENSLYYSFGGGRSMRGGNGGGAGGGFWVNGGWNLYPNENRPGGTGGAPYSAGSPNSVSGGGPQGGANAWDTTGGNGANGGILSTMLLPGTGGGGGGASNRGGGRGGDGGPGCGGGGGGAGFSNSGGAGGRGGDGSCLVIGIV